MRACVRAFVRVCVRARPRALSVSLSLSSSGGYIDLPIFLRARDRSAGHVATETSSIAKNHDVNGVRFGTGRWCSSRGPGVLSVLVVNASYHSRLHVAGQ